MTEVNGTSTTIVFVCWLPFKAEEERERKKEKAKRGEPVRLCPTSVLVNRAWTWYTSKVGGGQCMRVVSQSAPGRGVDNIPQ